MKTSGHIYNSLYPKDAHYGPLKLLNEIIFCCIHCVREMAVYISRLITFMYL